MTSARTRDDWGYERLSLPIFSVTLGQGYTDLPTPLSNTTDLLATL